MSLLRIRSGRRVLLATVLITALAVAAPVGTFAVIMAPMQHLSASAYWTVLGICAVIPLIIAPPISLLALSMLRLLTITIERVDDYVRFDSLTGALTRTYLLGRMRELLPGGGAMLIVDADHFKVVNDTYGHDVGDQALKRIAEVLRVSVPLDALVGRLGGEEFGVFLPGAGDVETAAVAAGLCKAMRKHGRAVAGHQLNMTISVGGAVHVDESSVEQTMKLADMALYQAKRSGRDRFHLSAAIETTPALILRARPG